nr:immunoglobulin light chain junction region [Macaca mulatta]MOW08989.1 immunoglobulin light chain junction region [Macaca mulatta]
CQQSNTFPFSF